MFPNQDHGRMMVNEEGSLIIESVQRQDSGEYICKGLSAAGSAYAKAKLEVRGRYSIQLLPWLHHSAYGHPFVQRPALVIQYSTILALITRASLTTWANLRRGQSLEGEMVW